MNFKKYRAIYVLQEVGIGRNVIVTAFLCFHSVCYFFDWCIVQAKTNHKNVITFIPHFLKTFFTFV